MDLNALSALLRLGTAPLIDLFDSICCSTLWRTGFLYQNDWRSQSLALGPFTLGRKVHYQMEYVLLFSSCGLCVV